MKKYLYAYGSFATVPGGKGATVCKLVYPPDPEAVDIEETPLESEAGQECDDESGWPEEEYTGGEDG